MRARVRNASMDRVRTIARVPCELLMCARRCIETAFHIREWHSHPRAEDRAGA
jgi:hypothetical protein